MSFYMKDVLVLLSLECDVKQVYLNFFYMGPDKSKHFSMRQKWFLYNSCSILSLLSFSIK